MDDSKQLSRSYVNSVVLDLAKNFWLERGGGTKFKVYNVGRDYLGDKSHLFPPGQTFDEVVATVAELLRRDGVVADLQHTVQESLLLEGAQNYGQVKVLELQVKGCTHLPMERKLAEAEIPPFVCPILNIISIALLKNQRVMSELASIKLEGDEACRVQVVLLDEKSE